MSRAPWKPLALGALIAATLLASLSALLAFGGQAGPMMSGRVFGFTESHDLRAFRILETSTGPAALAQAQLEAQRALDLAPYNNAARLRLVYIDTVRERALKRDGLAKLAQSYDLIPFDHTIAAWRVGFALDHWDRLTPEVRTAVHAEAMAFAVGHSQDANVRQVLASVHNPEGRVAAALWLQSLKH